MKRNLLTIIAALAAATGLQAQQSFPDQYRAAIAAYQSGDAEAFLAAATAARGLRPDSPQAAYLLAAAQAMVGHAADSIGDLRALAAGGLVFHPENEPAFESLGLAANAPELLAEFSENSKPAGAAEFAFRIDEPKFVPEGIAFDAKNQRFLLGSIHQRRILAIDVNGGTSEFVPADRYALLSVFGMRIESGSRSLYLATSGVKESGLAGEEHVGKAGIMQFDLDSAELKNSWWLPADGRQHVLGDLELLPGGGILTTDSLTGEVLKLDTGTGAFTAIVAAGSLVSPQGLVRSPDPSQVYVADYRGGIYRLGLADGALHKLAEAGTTHYGIDGLYRNGDWLIAIQNGVNPNRVLALRVDATRSAVTEYRVLASGLPEFDDPNLGVIVDGRLNFIANSHWPRFNQEGGLPDGLSGPVVMSVEVP